MTKLTKSLLNFVNAPKNVHSAHAVFMRFVFISEGTATSVIYRQTGFTSEIKNVFRAVRNGYLSRTIYHSFLNGSITILNYMILRSRRKCSMGLEFFWKMFEILWKAIAAAFELPEATVKSIYFIRRFR